MADRDSPTTVIDTAGSVSVPRILASEDNVAAALVPSLAVARRADTEELTGFDMASFVRLAGEEC
jgi:hypothetical protein